MSIPFLRAVSGKHRAAAVSYNALVAARSPALWWKLDDASGTTNVADSSGNANTGFVGGTPASFGWHSASIVTGQAFGLGFTDFLGSSASVSAMTTAYTQKVWYKGTNANQVVCGLSNSPNYNASSSYGANILITAGGFWQGSIYVPSLSAAVTCTGTTPVAAATRGCVSLEIDPVGQTMTLYVNGAQDSTVALGGAPDHFAGFVNVGYGGNSAVGPFYAGELQSYEFFNSALGAAEQLAEWNAGK